MWTARRRTDNAIKIHDNVAALPLPTGTGDAPSEKQRAPDGTANRYCEIRIIGKVAGPINIPGPVYVYGNEDAALGQGGASDEWNQAGSNALNKGAPIAVTDKAAYSEVLELAAAYRALALFNTGGAITGGNVDVWLIPYAVHR
jgi:hypothetical protein